MYNVFLISLYNIYFLKFLKRLTTRCQFHQRFMRTFFADILAQKITNPMFQLCNFWRQQFVQKICP
jgi:hypothetical protein